MGLAKRSRSHPRHTVRERAVPRQRGGVRGAPRPIRDQPQMDQRLKNRQAAAHNLFSWFGSRLVQSADLVVPGPCSQELERVQRELDASSWGERGGMRREKDSHVCKLIN